MGTIKIIIGEDGTFEVEAVAGFKGKTCQEAINKILDNLPSNFQFETIAKTEEKQVGEFINSPLTIIEMEHPAEYKAYLMKKPEIPPDELLMSALNDASRALAIKIVNTIDIDLDPWLLSQ